MLTHSLGEIPTYYPRNPQHLWCWYYIPHWWGCYRLAQKCYDTVLWLPYRIWQVQDFLYQYWWSWPPYIQNRVFPSHADGAPSHKDTLPGPRKRHRSSIPEATDSSSCNRVYPAFVCSRWLYWQYSKRRGRCFSSGRWVIQSWPPSDVTAGRLAQEKYLFKLKVSIHHIIQLVIMVFNISWKEY